MVRDLATSRPEDNTVVCFAQANNTVVNDGVTTVNCKSLIEIASQPLCFSYVIKSLKFSKGKIIHAHYPNILACLVVVLIKLFRVNVQGVVIHWHSDIVKQNTLGAMVQWLINLSLYFADKIVVTSDNYLDGSRQLMKYRKKCVVIPIGISERVTVSEASSTIMDEPYDGVKIFALGRHVSYKGFDVLVRGMMSVEGARLYLGGDGPDSGKLSELTRELGLESKIRFLGRISDDALSACYSNCDIFCLPSVSRAEAFGVVQLEAFSFAKPVISARIFGSGVGWVNQDQSTGLLFKMGDAEDLAAKLRMLIAHPLMRKNMGKAAQKRFKELFTKEKMQDAFRTVYNDLSSSA